MDKTLLDAIQQALERDRVTRQQRGKLAELRKRYATLTAREREVMAFGGFRDAGISRSLLSWGLAKSQ